MFSFICSWTNWWVHNRDTGDLRRHCTHSNVTVMPCEFVPIYFIHIHQLLQCHFQRPHRPLCMIVSSHSGYRNVCWTIKMIDRTNLNQFHPAWFSRSYLMNTHMPNCVFFHDDVIKWKHFPRHWQRPVTGAELWCFLWSACEWTVV